MNKWETFKGWHGQETFWREVYARTVSTLIAAAVVLLLGVVFGVIKVHTDVFARVGATIGVALLFLLLQSAGYRLILRRSKAGGTPRLSNLVAIGFVLYTVALVVLASAAVVRIRHAWM